MPVNNSAENVTHCRIIKLIDGNGVEVTQEAWGDWIASTARRAHSSDQLNINQFHSCGLLEVIPDVDYIHMCHKLFEYNPCTSSSGQAIVSVIL